MIQQTNKKGASKWAETFKYFYGKYTTVRDAFQNQMKLTFCQGVCRYCQAANDAQEEPALLPPHTNPCRSTVSAAAAGSCFKVWSQRWGALRPVRTFKIRDLLLWSSSAHADLPAVFNFWCQMFSLSSMIKKKKKCSTTEHSREISISFTRPVKIKEVTIMFDFRLIGWNTWRNKCFRPQRTASLN